MRSAHERNWLSFSFRHVHLWQVFQSRFSFQARLVAEDIMVKGDDFQPQPKIFRLRLKLAYASLKRCRCDHFACISVLSCDVVCKLHSFRWKNFQVPSASVSVSVVASLP